MVEKVHITLHPLGKTLEADRGAALQDILFDYGVEFPCGGTGRCHGCRIRVIQGTLPITPFQREALSAAELEQGWRLSCHCTAEEDLVLEIGQWEAPVLTDHSKLEFTPSEGLGIAIDLGTTTLAAHLMDLSEGTVLAVETGLNPQALYGADIMSRVQFALNDGGQATLEKLIRRELGQYIDRLLNTVGISRDLLRRVVVVGNSVMHHLFCGIDITPLATYPFEPIEPGLKQFAPAQLDWQLPSGLPIQFLPCLGSFVGSDILAGIAATGLHEHEDLNLLVDLGTNGEMVLGHSRRLLCASTAAGPAFEGGRIFMGMQASTGAISQVQLEAGEFQCHVIGGGRPRGLCGSGLVDGVASALEMGLVLPSGRIRQGQDRINLCAEVYLRQADIRELQLAKGAIAAGIQILLDRFGVDIREVQRVYLAGAFGNYINPQNARRIGLLDFPAEKIVPVGNSALLGAKMALFNPPDEPPLWEAIQRRVEHLPLASDPAFHDKYADAMFFPSIEHCSPSPRK